MNFVFSTIKRQLNKMCLLLTLFLVITGFSQSANAYIVTTIKPIGFIVEAIGSNVIETKILLPDGASPHVYALKPGDIQKIKNADVVIWVGRDLETFMPSILKRVNKNKQLALMDEPTIKHLIYHNTHHDGTSHSHHHDIDSHIWISPKIAKQIAVAVHNKLIALYPDKKKQVDKNLNYFINKLNDTEQIIAKNIVNIQNRGYFVFHDAYGYFERQFGLKNLGEFTINPEIQPGAEKIYNIRHQLINNNNVVCVFKEPQFNPAIINKVIEGTRVQIGTLDPLGSRVSLSKDAYFNFLTNLTSQYHECLSRDNQ